MTDSLFDIPELAKDQSPGGLIRIPMEQDVPFTQRVRAIVDTVEFQRLRGISQLGLVSRVYPGATHSRFEHALGVFNNAVRYLLQLGRDPRFCERVDRKLGELLLVSALLHDLGHWPFCHPIEDMKLPNLPPHEQFAREFLSPESELSHVLESEWKIDANDVLDVLVPKTDSSELRLIRSILSGPIDIDKLDYLDRDSLHAGVPYGRNFDRKRLMESLVLNEQGDGLALNAKGKTAAEMMVFARYVMFSEVYWHHAVRSATCMFARAFYNLHTQLDLHSFFMEDESESIRQLKKLSSGTSTEPLIEGIFGRQRALYKRVAEFSYDFDSDTYGKIAGRPYPEVIAISEKLATALQEITGESISSDDLLIDAPPVHKEVEIKIDLYFPKENVYRPLQRVSPVVESLARKQFDDYVKRVRVFCHPRLRDCLKEQVEIESVLQDILSKNASN